MAENGSISPQSADIEEESQSPTVDREWLKRDIIYKIVLFCSVLREPLAILSTTPKLEACCVGIEARNSAKNSTLNINIASRMKLTKRVCAGFRPLRGFFGLVIPSICARTRLIQEIKLLPRHAH